MNVAAVFYFCDFRFDSGTVGFELLIKLLYFMTALFRLV